eukprot:TRINITY_DN10712_c0_g1_i1.p1 TRINITY_DN10712_c0_g1~~TRINITY_DN10712_c0_g1_i1.p1  ORF type:complete len:200 (+),score=33.23 TRINITY_DN10712_c0_g1_i1:73-600(+)
MGCGMVKEQGSEVVTTEPSPFHNALRMKRYSMVAGLKLALAGRDLYSDNRSMGSLESTDRARLENWVKGLPSACSSDSDTDAGSVSDCQSLGSLHTVEDCPFSSEAAHPLPPSRTTLVKASPNTALPPVRLTTKSQLLALEREVKMMDTQPLDVVLKLPPASRKQLPPIVKKAAA